MSTPEMRVCAVKGMTVVCGRIRRRLGKSVLALGERDDRAAFRRLVGEARGERRGGEILGSDAAHRQELGRHAVAEGDRAGLVEQQRVDVARRLDRAARGGDNVEPDQPIHAGDADRRQKAADRRRNEADEQRDQHGRRKIGPRIFGDRPERHADDQEDERQAGQQDGQRQLVRRLLPFGAFDQRDHAIDEGRAGRCGDPDLDEVGENRRAAGHGRAIAARFANDGRGFAGDRGFVDRGDALDDVAVTGDDLAGLDQNDVCRRRSSAFTPSRGPSRFSGST